MPIDFLMNAARARVTTHGNSPSHFGERECTSRPRVEFQNSGLNGTNFSVRCISLGIDEKKKKVYDLKVTKLARSVLYLSTKYLSFQFYNKIK